MTVAVPTQEQIDDLWRYIAMLLTRIEELERIVGANK